MAYLKIKRSHIEKTAKRYFTNPWKQATFNKVKKKKKKKKKNK